MPGVTVDGTDAWAVYRAATQALTRARAGGGPSLIEAIVPRMTGHSSQDDDEYRSQVERDAARAADPIPRLRTELLERGLLSEADDAALVRSTNEQVTAAVDRALVRAQPDPARARPLAVRGRPAAHAGASGSQNAPRRSARG